MPFRLNFAQNDEAIDLSKVITWACEFHSNDENRQEMLRYLNKHASWGSAYENVFKLLREKNGR